jgi:tetratricopeptide (TPR) repeat protein
MATPVDISRPKRSLILLALCAFVAVALVALLVGGSESHLAKAASLETEGLFEEASESYRLHLLDEPDSLDALRGLAITLAVTGRFDEALDFQRRVCEADSSDAQTRVELALNYLNHQGRPDEAVGAMLEAVAVDPSPRNRALAGQVLIAAGQVAAGEEALRTLIQSEPQYGYPYQILVRHLERHERHEEAVSVRSLAEARGIVLDKPSGGGA